MNKCPNETLPNTDIMSGVNEIAYVVPVDCVSAQFSVQAANVDSKTVDFRVVDVQR